MAAAKTEPKYVYGVVAGQAPAPKVEGIAGAPVELVAEGDVAALASTSPGEQLEAGREELLTHSRVLQVALESSTVLPMRFGVVMPDAETVRERLLTPHHEELAAQLREMEGKVEVSIKGVYEEAELLREILAEDREAARLREAIQGKPADATYYERIRLGELIAAAIGVKQEEDSRLVVAALSPHAVEVTVGEPVHERMAVSASFLVERSNLAEFDRAVDKVGEAQAGRIRFKYTGPLPPHSFVELGVRA